MENKPLTQVSLAQAPNSYRKKYYFLARLEKLLKKYTHFIDIHTGMRTKFFKLYGIVVSTSIGASLAGQYMQNFIGSNSFFFSALAVLVSAWCGGIEAGVIATALSTIGFICFFLLNHHLQSIPVLPLSIFIAEGIGISIISQRFQHMKELKELRQKEKDFTQIIIYQKLAYEKAQQEIKSRDEFLSIASHELKTPLTSMLLKLQFALRSIRTVSLANFSVENLMNMLESAEQQTLHLSKMINDLLNVSLLTTGRIALDLEEGDLKKIIETTIENFAEKLKQEKYILQTNLAEGVIGKWDKIRLEQIIGNLLSNSIKYGNHKPIMVTLQKNSTHARLSVADLGIGIQNKDKKRIFSLFERSVDSKEYAGLGVGLFITSQLVRAHKGTLKVESQVGKGSTFIVELPYSPKRQK